MNLKIFKELKSIKFEGITKRWLTNIVSVILAVLIIVFIIAVFTIRTYYYNSVESILNSGASTAAVSYFSTNLDSGTSLETSAAKFIDSYSYKDKTTVWIIDNDGKVIASSNGFTYGESEMPDYKEAMANQDGISRYVGKDNGSEKIMAVSRVITDSNGANVGAVRVMTSVEEIDRQIFIILLVIFFVLVLIFIAIAASNLFFISSIVIPLKEITEKTKEISGGNLDVRIEKKYDDEIGKLSDSINSMAADIATADTMKNDFISTISHELRTPLTSIKGWGETLLFGLDRERDEVTNKGLQVIVNEAGRLEGFVEELLDFSRLQSGRMTLRLMKTDIFAELDETVFTFRERAMREGIEVRYSIPDFPAPANADPNRLKQVFMNILDNALKYSKMNTKIFVKAEFSEFNGKNAIKVSIADQGCGISKETGAHIFEKFYQGDTSHAQEGNGLGLALVKKVIDLLGGEISVESEPGKGSIFTVKLKGARNVG